MNKLPLCVDLDHTLINTDLTFEAIVEAIKNNPVHIFKVFKFIISGRKKELKSWLADHVDLEWSNLPLNHEIEEYMNREINSGRDVYLVSGSHQKYLSKIHRLFPQVKEAVGTTHEANLIGKNKADYLVKRFGEKGFDYLGDSHQDLYVWSRAHAGLIISKNKKLIRKVQNKDLVFKTSRNSLKHIIKGIRVNQWIKNLLIFLPAILAHDFFNLELWGSLIFGAILYSFVASSIYLINDIVDIPNDRVHRTKKFRPIASGNLDIPLAIKLIFIFLLFSFVGAFLLNKSFFVILVIYFISNLLYSLKLKKIAIIDVFLLSGFYLIRIAAGSEIGNIPLSPWLKSFSFFLFLSLGFLKRYAEVLLNYIKSGVSTSHGRAYVYQDTQVLFGFGILSAYISVLVLSLYIYQGQVSLLYKHPDFMWGIVILLAYWKTSLWFKASHAKVKDDPVKHIVTDRESIFIMFLVFACFVLAIT